MSILFLLIPYSTLSCPPLSIPPVSLAKSWLLIIFIEQTFILKILVLEINSKKNFLIFLIIMYNTTIIQLLFFKFSSAVCFCKLSMKLARAISSSSSSFTSDHLKSIAFFIIIRICFLISKPNINWFLLFFIVYLQVIAIIFD